MARLYYIGRRKQRPRMHPGRVAAACLVVAIIGLLIIFKGCAYGQEIRSAIPHCVPLSILNAWTWGVKTGCEVRIGISRIDERTDHAQAEARIDGAWVPLTEVWNGRGLEVRPHQYHYREPYRYLTLREWINEQIVYAEGGGKP